MMYRYIAQRALLFIPTVVLLSMVVFGFLRIMPGDPALGLVTGGAGGGGRFTPEQLEDLRHELGTDRPIPVQYGKWMWGLLRGDLGTSYWHGTSAVELIKPRIAVSLQLTGMAIAISFFLAVPLGVISAFNRNTIIDYVARVISLLGIAIPEFVTGIVTIYLLVRVFNWLPPLDYTPPTEDLGKNLSQLIFPAIALSGFITAFTARVTRSTVLEVLREDYIRTARSKGLRERSVIFTHALRNALLPIMSLGGWVVGLLLAGTVIIESIFVLPGMGTLLLTSIVRRDYPVIQGEVLLITGLVLLVNLVIDFLYIWVDPRVRLSS